MTPQEKARVAALEGKVESLHRIVEQLAALIAPPEPEDPVAASFAGFQRRADERTRRS